MKGKAGEKILLEAIERILGNCERLVVGYPQCIPIELRNMLTVYKSISDEPAPVERDLTCEEAYELAKKTWGQEAQVEYTKSLPGKYYGIYYRMPNNVIRHITDASFRGAFEKAGVKVEGGK